MSTPRNTVNITNVLACVVGLDVLGKYTRGRLSSIGGDRVDL